MDIQSVHTTQQERGNTYIPYSSKSMDCMWCYIATCVQWIASEEESACFKDQILPNMQ